VRARKPKPRQQRTRSCIPLPPSRLESSCHGSLYLPIGPFETNYRRVVESSFNCIDHDMMYAYTYLACFPRGQANELLQLTGVHAWVSRWKLLQLNGSWRCAIVFDFVVVYALVGSAVGVLVLGCWQRAKFWTAEVSRSRADESAREQGCRGM
jgi:hypothetical protein